MRHVMLLRHGTAHDHSANGDRGRQLTDAGKNEVMAAAHAIVKLGWMPSTILHSPYVRAVETATIVAHVLKMSSLTVVDDLVPNGDTGGVMNEISGCSHDVLLVSHLPLLPALLHTLTGQPSTLMMSPASLTRVVMLGKTSGAVDGFLTAEHAARLSSAS